MVILGRIRGHGGRLASYLLTQGENESIRILDVDGQRKFDESDFRLLLKDFSLNEKLTRSRKGLYHASINPKDDEAIQLKDKQWLEAADILAEELGFSEQRRAIVLHKKLGRVHAHVVFERYNYSGKMIPIDHNYSKHDRARRRMEVAFTHQPTPKKNSRRDMVKQELTEVWNDTRTANDFIRQAKAKGYVIAKGSRRTPFAVVDETGRSYNLTRQIEGFQTNDIRNRLGNTVLTDEKSAIAFVRTQQSISRQINTEKSDTDKFREQLEKLKQKKQILKPRMR